VKEVTATGQTVKEAVKSALTQLQVTEDRTIINIIDEGKRGLLGIFGSRPAVVKVSLKIDPIEEAKKFLLDVSKKMGSPVMIDVKRNGRQVTFYLKGEKIALLIGKRGQTLNSLQYLTQLFINRLADQYINITLDAEGYREKRNETLTVLAVRIAEKVMNTGKEIPLEPMPSYERKVIHTALVGNKKVKTFSSGEDPHRYIVIAPK
jgi:spoIIIJ-associated protein